ncbi:hypothetical protein [Wolbachia endosymbiont of Trichogramma pretiosum]|uniref:hypothetical protein n=1 Tax=Wolbachia endosymbiont of Trichogramma pretiosum TaxID=125593 RepID=UPI000B0566F0|nr:hypothetical protein [Wolbachia endosymbiont of Trichogramma pretiosum]OCA05719.1 hypothetical protein wTpre_38 [Wolbachia endosymbiont of Trichogramma pretiosum]
MLDKILNQVDTTLEKLALKELLKLSVLQEKESTKLESPQNSGVEHCNGRQILKYAEAYSNMSLSIA